MKVTPNNQTLILAGERGYGVPSRGALVSALPDGSSGSVLKTVTIMTALPDTTLIYLRADYAPPADYSLAADAPSQPTVISRISALNVAPPQCSEPERAQRDADDAQPGQRGRADGAARQPGDVREGGHVEHPVGQLERLPEDVQRHG